MAFETTCGRCGSKVNAEMRFCPSCGRGLRSRARGFVPAAIGLSALLCVAGLGLQLMIRGTKVMHPVTRGNVSESLENSSSELSDPQLVAMRKAVEESPDDITRLKVYAGMLGDVLRANPGAQPALVFEAIDVFGRILQREPNDPAALVMMADVSFDQRAFTKALDFYERYLKVESHDLGARARYASTLTFLGRYDDSIKELEVVLKDDPKNFPAKAYLAITYAQRGDMGRAKQIGGEALALAPSDEARARFSSFVSSLDEAQADVMPQGSINQAAAGNESAPSASSEKAGLIASLKANPVAGPKFVRVESSSANAIALFYKDFPMSQMPPFAKQKFISGVQAAIKQNGMTGIRTIEFRDAVSGSVMESTEMGGD